MPGTDLLPVQVQTALPMCSWEVSPECCLILVNNILHRPSLVPILDLDVLNMRYSTQQVMHCVCMVCACVVLILWVILQEMRTPNLANFVEQFHNTSV